MAEPEIIPANSILFEEFCITLKELQRKKKKLEKFTILTDFLDEVNLNIAKVVGKKNCSIFPILRLLLPNLERERTPYNMKETKLGNLLVKVLSIDKKSHDAQKLINFKSVGNSIDADFPSAAYFVVKNRIGKNAANMTIGQINELLDRIATAQVGNKGHALDEAFSFAIRNLSAEQLKWFLRLILKNLKIGMATSQILSAFHPDAPEYYETCTNLLKVCDELADGGVRSTEVQMFYAISPMLCERLDVQCVTTLPTNKTYHIEEKFDGERFQMHMENGVFEYFSKKGHTYSDKYGKTYDSGLLTCHLKNCFSSKVTSFILDGEMMGWHKEHQCFGSKGMAFDIKTITENSKFRPCYCVFDLLYYNGKSLLGPSEKGGVPLTERLKLLDAMFADIPGVICHSKARNVTKSSDILDALNKAIDSQEEGIVVKETNSHYIPNKRNAGWYKIKPEYTEGTMSDLDLVIIGAEEAENKRQGRAKSFYVACAETDSPGGVPRRWVCVGRAATGLSHAEREATCRALERHWTSSKDQSPPSTLVFNKEKPDFWVLPEHSVVLEIRATELIRSSSYGTAYTLRFPRIIRVRDDKPVNHTMTLDEFNRLADKCSPVVKLSNKRINEDQIEEVTTKTRKKVTKLPQVPEQFRVTATDVETTSKALLGRRFYIISDDEDCKRVELAKIILSHGGKHVVNNGGDRLCVVGRMNTRAISIIKSGANDVLSTSWLRSLPPSETPCRISPLDMLSIKDTTRLKLLREYDSFGDSYTEPVDEAILRKCFDKMDVNEPDIFLTTQEMIDVDEILFGDVNPYSFLRKCYVHSKSNGFQALKAQMYGATICDIDATKLTHVVMPKICDKEDIDSIKCKVKGLVVSEDWLEQCFTEGKMVPETEFML